MAGTAVRSWRILLPLFAVLVLFSLWSAYWFVAVDVIKERVAAERAVLIERGVTLSCTTESWSGFPFHFELSCSSPVLTVRNQIEARATQLLFVALAYAPWQVVALLDGPTVVTGAGFAPVSVFHQRIIAAVTLDKEWRPQVSVNVPKIDIADMGRIGRAMIHARPAEAGGYDLAASLSDLVYQSAERPPFLISQGDFLGTLTEDHVLNVDKVEFRQDQIRYWGRGQIQLDNSGRISGKLATETNDLDGLVRLIEPQLQLTEQQVNSLRTVLGLLGSQAMVNIFAKDGQLFIGPFRIAELRPLY